MIEVFKPIGSSLGQFLEVDMPFVDLGSRRVEKILVSVDLIKGLSYFIELHKGSIQTCASTKLLGGSFQM